jgi:AraC family transcriptional regulator of adaptative response/methylated-DNA-[protein]-cysteine methyltransferase
LYSNINRRSAAMHAIDQQRHAIRTLGDPRWARIVGRDPTVDGAFYYSVKTTGVYCRPSCAARLPRPESVDFHATPASAERAGFRPCKRCRPEQGRDGAKAVADPSARDLIRFAVGASPFGSMLVARSAEGVCAILLGDDRAVLAQDLQRRFPASALRRDDAGLSHEIAEVAAFIEAPVGDLELPLDLRGTDFQQRVWRVLRDIGAGTTASYAQVAQRIGAPASARAVAGACAANPLAVAIPCHRVVRSDGGLSGYRWGAQRKRALLEREARA